MIRQGDASLPNRHHLLIGKSGCGKSSWLRQHRELNTARRLLAWDPDEDHQLDRRVRSIRDLRDAVVAAGNGALRIALTLPSTAVNFDLFCRVVWAAASCTRPTVVLVDEFQRAAPIDAKAPTWEGLCLTGRKHGLALWAAANAPVGINRMIYRQAGHFWIGELVEAQDISLVADMAEVSRDELRALKPVPSGRSVVLPYLYGVRGSFRRGELRMKKSPLK